MIKFFRKIRHDLLNQNQMGKYFKYAIGEILLGVIGILIALQINNWNENNKAIKQETIHLQNLKAELQISLNELYDDLALHKNNFESTLDVYEYIQNKPVLVDSMLEDFYNVVRFNYFFPKTTTYETLKSGNLEVIKSDSLRAKITDVYESGYERIKRKVGTRRNAGRLLFPYYQKHFKTEVAFARDTLNWRNMSSKIGIPNDYEIVINDPEYQSLIVEAIYGRLTFNYDFERSIAYVESCINAIDSYLKE